jgi:uncharacterized protein YrzB (UPF0473 family)
VDKDYKFFTVKDSKGNLKEYEIIYKFDSNETKKSYVVYTDHEMEDGLIKVYANVYDKTGRKRTLMPIQTEEEWNTIETFLSKLEGIINEKN